MDNFAGVFVTMQAYFSGKLPWNGVRIELTHGEETDMLGAHVIRDSLIADDIVIVVDVTGYETNAPVVIEKCKNKQLRDFVESVLRKNNFKFEIFGDCLDPVATEDETDVYRQTNRFTLFFGIPCHGGDYNNEPVKIPKKNLLLASEALVVLINELHRNFETQGRGLRKTVSFDGNLEHPEFKES